MNLKIEKRNTKTANLSTSHTQSRGSDEITRLEVMLGDSHSKWTYRLVQFQFDTVHCTGRVVEIRVVRDGMLMGRQTVLVLRFPGNCRAITKLHVNQILS
jgi:hypothetical protein